MNQPPQETRVVVAVDGEPILTMGLRLELRAYLPPGVRIETEADGAEALGLLLG